MDTKAKKNRLHMVIISICVMAIIFTVITILLTPKGKIKSTPLRTETEKLASNTTITTEPNYVSDSTDTEKLASNTTITAEPNYVSDSDEYYFLDMQFEEYPFNKTFVVTDPTHKYGNAFFSNTGTFAVKVSIYDQNNLLVGYDTAEPNNDVSILFNTETGNYQITIQNGGVEKIQGILSIKTNGKK